MSLKTYSGSCHCGAVRFQADIDLSKGTNRCNCSLCTKARAWFVVVQPENFRLSQGAEALAEYEWTPEKQAHPSLHYRFCRTCGIRAFAQGDALPPSDRPFYGVAVSALDDADPDELASSIRYLDGRNDRFDRKPDDTRLM